MRFLYSFLLVLSLSSCSLFSQDELSGRITEETSKTAEVSMSYEGELQTLEENISFSSRATHRLILNTGEDLLLRSPTISLDPFLGEVVTITGDMTSAPGGIQVLSITTIEKIQDPLEGEKEIVWKTYNDKSSRFTFSYPEIWQVLWAQKVTLLKNADATVVKITRFDNSNNLSLPEFVKESFEEVTVGGKVALKVEKSDGLDIYFSANGEIIKVSFFGAEDSPEEEQFFTLLQSMVFSEFQQDIRCGGAENILCPNGFRCEITAGNTGMCIPFSEKVSTPATLSEEIQTESEFSLTETMQETPEGTLYENTFLSFHLYYPKSWWWKSFGPQEKTSLWRIEFSEKEIENVGDGSIMVDVKNGGSGKVEETEDGVFRIFIPRDENTHFEVSGNAGMEKFIRDIANSIQSTY